MRNCATFAVSVCLLCMLASYPGAVAEDVQKPISGVLRVPGAKLHYEVLGEGPMLLFIPGANGDGPIFHSVARHLADRYKVVTYARRGFSQSSIDAEPDDTTRLEIDAADVSRLIKHFGDEPAYLFGNSSGAIVALEALVRHSEVIRKVVAHEPPLVRYQPDAEREHWTTSFQKIAETYKISGLAAAMEMFGGTLSGADAEAMREVNDLAGNQFMTANADFWVKHELNVYTQAALDLQVLMDNKEKLTLGLSVDSGKDLTFSSITGLAKKLNVGIASFPGGHIGFFSQPDEFAIVLDRVLRGE